MNTIKAIETEYKGYRFRSRLEARWAVFFDALGVKWEYEKEGFDLGDYGWYLPDFWLPDLELWIEVKGQMPTDEDTLKLIALYEMTGHPAFVFMQIPDSVDDHSWFEDLSPQTTGAPYWSHAIKVADKLPLSMRQDEYTGTENQYQFICPVCKDDYVHFGTPNEVHSDDYTAWDGGRGGAARVPMWCEQGHSWTFRFGFHKGLTFVAIENVWEEISNPGLALAQNYPAVFREALRLARSARFEHGEKGAKVRA